MAQIDLPPVDSALANQTVVILTTPPAASTGIPTVAEVNAGIFMQGYLYGRFNTTPNQNTSEGPRKLGARTAPIKLGQVTYDAIEISYSYIPQQLGTPGHIGNKAYEALPPGVRVTAVVLDGKPGDTTTAVAVNDIADILLCNVGARAKGVTGDGEADELNVTQKLTVDKGEPIKLDHKLAAA